MKTGTIKATSASFQRAASRSSLSKAEELQKQFFKYLSGGMAVGALVWGLIAVYFELYAAATIPGAFIVLTYVNFKLCCDKGQLNLAFNIQTLTSVALPIAFQTMLGGYQATGAVMLWSLVSLMGAMTFQQRNIIYGWFAVFVSLMLWAVLNEDWISKENGGQVDGAGAILFSINIVMISSILFGLSRYFIVMQQKMRKAIVNRSNAIKEVNREVKTQNSEIVQSIRYAQNLQSNILPREHKLKDAFQDYFILFKPKDVVSGDFYWFAEEQGLKFFATIDCTGHGVPGAFMSMMAYNLINEVVRGQRVLKTNEILERLNHAVIRSLKQQATGNQDGMDLSIVCIDESKKEIAFSGARSHLFVTQPDGSSEMYRGDRLSIGGVHRSLIETFKVTTIPYQTGTMIYMATDGITDQFGGENNKKFGQKQLTAWFKQQSKVNMRHQQFSLEQTLEHWQGQEAQIDDILVVGLML